MPDQPLALLLLRASRWFDRQLLERLEARGWPRLTSAQSLVFPHLGPQGISPAELARALDVARQSTHELVSGLERLGLVESRVDPRHQRRRSLVLTPRGERLAADARAILADLEAELGAGGRGRAGVDVDALRHLLDVDVLAEPAPSVHPRAAAAADALTSLPRATTSGAPQRATGSHERT